MHGPVELGISGLRAEPGDHICAFYRPAERDAVLVPYLRAGLDAAEKCICVVEDPETWVETALGVEVQHDECAALEAWAARETYLAGGDFTPEQMLEFWGERIRAALERCNFEFARSAGDMIWALQVACPVEDLQSYEAQLDHVLAGRPQVMLCLYDMQRFSGDVLLAALKTHRRILVDGLVLENPYYSPLG